jgi:phosphonate transport system ATP-binding protein
MSAPTRVRLRHAETLESQPIPDAIVWTDRLSVVYPGGTPALRAVSLALRPGEIVAVIGASGAGKSTLLRAINGLVMPSAASVSVAGLGRVIGDGHARPRTLRAHRRRAAIIFQSHQLIGRFSALQNVLLGRLGHRGTLRSVLPAGRADQMLALQCLARVGLADKALARADQLSGGQQQRVGIARALAQQPSLILADEPVASLDPATAERVLALLRDICAADGLAAVISLHQIEFARRFADRVIALANGAVMFDGAAAELGSRHLKAIYGATPAHHDQPPVMEAHS